MLRSYGGHAVGNRKFCQKLGNNLNPFFNTLFQFYAKKIMWRKDSEGVLICFCVGSFTYFFLGNSTVKKFKMHFLVLQKYQIIRHVSRWTKVQDRIVYTP